MDPKCTCPPAYQAVMSEVRDRSHFHYTVAFNDLHISQVLFTVLKFLTAHRCFCNLDHAIHN
jgi:hypothetical protein